MQIIVTQTIPESFDSFEIAAGSWEATAGRIEVRNGRRTDLVDGFILKRNNGRGWSFRELPLPVWTRHIAEGRIRCESEPFSEQDAEGETLMSIQRMGRA